MSGIMQLLLASRPQAVPDPYFEYTTLLLPGNGTNGAQNNTFLDSSTNNFTITRNGNTTQGTFSPFSQTGWGNYFDGSGDYLTLPADAAFTFGTGDFTIEGWIYISALDAVNAKGVFQQGTSSFPASTTNTVALGVTPAATYSIYAKNTFTNSTATATLNSWTHFALVRSGTTTTLYANGTAVITVTSDSTNYTGTFFGIGSIYGTSGTNWNGYISNFRVVKGTAVYTANFTPSTTPLTAISGTSLLTCQSNRFIDNSTNNFTITRNGDVSVQAFSPFNPTAAWSAATNGGSGYFDGSGDYLTLNGGTPLTFGTGDFTIEFWYYSNNSGVQQILYDGRPAGTNGIYVTIFKSSGNVLELFVNNAVVISGATAVNATSWNHVALSRSGTSTKLFLNGVQQGSTYTDSNNYLNGTSRPAIGSDGATIGNLPLNGYLSDLRVLKGTALYTAAFTPPTAPLTAIANTSLLLNFTNAGIFDATSKNDLETVGNAQISTTQSKFGGSSMYFDGTGDYLAKYIADPQTIFGTGDFTFECWVYPTTLNSYNMILGYASPNQYWSIRNTGYLHFYDGTTTYEATTNAVLTNQWTHIAISRSGSTLRQFVNGVQALSSTCATSIGAASALWFGASAAYPSQHFFTGYINDLRVTKGVARYTANFTAPTAAFPLL